MVLQILMSTLAILMAAFAIWFYHEVGQSDPKPPAAFTFALGLLCVPQICVIMLQFAVPILLIAVPHQDHRYFLWLVLWSYVCGLLPGFLSLILRKSGQKRIPLPHDGEAQLGSSRQ